MRKRFYLCDVEVTKYKRQNTQVKGAITALDVKISEFLDRINSDQRYSTGNRALVGMGEIIGELKFMYLSGVLTPTEFHKIFGNLTGQEYEEEN